MIDDTADDDAPRSPIAQVEAAAPPPGSIRSFEDFAAWRAAEDRRMLAELAAQLEAFNEIAYGDVTVH